MKYFIQFILLISTYTCFAWSDCDSITYKDTNYVLVYYNKDSMLKNIVCQTDSFVYTTSYYPNGKLAKERFSMYSDNIFNVYNSWDTSGNPLVVNGNGYHYEYFKNGTIKREGFYTNQLQDSVWKYYNENGNIEQINKYKVIDGISVYIRIDDFYMDGKIHRKIIFYDKEDEYGNWNMKELKVYDKKNGNLIAIGFVCDNSIKNNVDSLNQFFYSKGYSESEDIIVRDCHGYPQTASIWSEANLNYQFNRVWYNDGTIRMKFEYDTLEKVLKYYEFHSNARLKTTGNVRYFSLDDIGENCPVKFKEEKNSRTKQLYGYLKCDIWKEFDELGNVCSETNMNNEFSEERKIFFDDVDTDE